MTERQKPQEDDFLASLLEIPQHQDTRVTPDKQPEEPDTPAAPQPEIVVGTATDFIPTEIPDPLRGPRKGVDIPIIPSDTPERRAAKYADARVTTPEHQMLMDELAIDPETTRAVIVSLAAPSINALLDVVRFAQSSHQAAPGHSISPSTDRRLATVGEAVDTSLRTWDTDPRILMNDFVNSFDPTSGALQGLVFSAEAGDHLTRAILRVDPESGARYVDELAKFLRGDYVELRAMDHFDGLVQKLGIKTPNPMPTVDLAASVMRQMGISITGEAFSHAIVGRLTWELRAYMAASLRLEEMRPKLVESKRKQLSEVERAQRITHAELANIEGLLVGTDSEGKPLPVYANYVVVEIPLLGQKVIALPDSLRGKLRLHGEEQDSSYQSPITSGATGDGHVRGLLRSFGAATEDIAGGIAGSVVVGTQLDAVRKALERKAEIERYAEHGFEVVPVMTGSTKMTERQQADLRIERWQMMLRIFDLRTRQISARGDQDRAELTTQALMRQMRQDLIDWRLTQDALTLTTEVIHTNQEATRGVFSAISRATHIARQQRLDAQRNWLDLGMERLRQSHEEFTKKAGQATSRMARAHDVASAETEQQMEELVAAMDDRRTRYTPGVDLNSDDTRPGPSSTGTTHLDNK